MKAVIAIAVLALVFALVPSVSAAVLGPDTDCIICDTVQGAGPNECWIINDQSNPQATSARTFLWDNSIKNNTWDVEGICFLPHKSTSDYNLFLNGTSLDFGYANLTLHFKTVNLTNSILYGTNCAGNVGNLKIIADDLIYVDANSRIGSQCGNVTLESPNIFIEGRVDSNNVLSLKNFALINATETSVIRSFDSFIASSAKPGQAFFGSAISAASSPLNPACANGNMGFEFNAPNQEVTFNNSISVPNCHMRVAAQQVNFNGAVHAWLGALAVEAGGLSITSRIVTKYSQNYILSGPADVASTASLQSDSHWIAFNSNYTGATENFIVGSIKATNKRPDLPYASDYPGILFKDSIFLYFPYSALTINSTIGSFRGFDANDVGFVEDPAPAQAITDLSKWTYTKPVERFCTNYVNPPTCAEWKYDWFYAPTPTWFASGNSFSYDGDRWASDGLNVYSSPDQSVNISGIGVGIFPRINQFTLIGDNFTVVISAIITAGDIGSSCSDLFQMAQNGFLNISVGEDPNNLQTVNFTTANPNPPVCKNDNQMAFWLLNNTPEGFVLVNSKFYFEAGKRYYYKINACNSTNPDTCVETPIYSFVASANPRPSGVALYDQKSYSNFEASAKIDFLDLDGGNGDYSAEMYFRVNQAVNNGDGYAYVARLFANPNTKNLSVELRRCNAINVTSITDGDMPSTPSFRLQPPFCLSTTQLGSVVDVARLIQDPSTGKLKPEFATFWLKITAETDNFKIYFSPTKKFGKEVLQANDPTNNNPGLIGFGVLSSNVRFSDFHVGVKPTEKARADIAIAANKLTLGQNANIGADYENLNPGTTTGGSVFLFGREMDLLDNNATGCDQIVSDACAQFSQTTPGNCKPYVYTNPCNPQSFFFKLGCFLTQSFDDNNTNYYARAPTTYKEEFCISQAQLTLFGVVKTPAGAKIPSGSVFVEKVADASGAPVINNLLNAPWSAAFGDSIVSGDAFILMGGAGTPVLWLLPASTYYVHVWVSDCADDSFSFKGSTPCKRHKYVVKFEA